MTSSHVRLIRQVMTLAGDRLGGAYAYDAGWIESVEKKASVMKERLEGDLQASRTSMAKESIRLVSQYNWSLSVSCFALPNELYTYRVIWTWGISTINAATWIMHSRILFAPGITVI